MAELTPMMRQYLEIKERHPDCILFFRLGDFYEMFADDAKLASHELDLMLTTRDRGKEKSEQVPMCGVPYHSAESYIARLVARGYKVAICEQMEDPALAKGLVKRDITRIVTPGTVIESSMLDESRNNYFACVFGEGGRYGLSFCDISTGAFYATQAEGAEAMERVISELGRFAPAEVLRGGDAAKSEELTRTLQERLSCCADLGADELFAPQETAQLVEKQFGKPLDELGLTERPEVWRSAGALLRTLCELQKTGLSHVRELEFYVSGRFMELDLSARRNLELTETMRAGEKRGSLLWVLDHTKTAMGSRMLRSWLEKPLLSPKRINARLDAVEELTKNSIGRDELVHMLQDVSDYERVTARIVTGAANCRDLVSLGNGCEPLPELRAAIGGLHASMFGVLLDELDDLSDLRDEIRNAIVDEPPFSVREGGMIRDGYSEELDQLRDIVSGGKGTLARIEAEEREKTGIKTLRVGYNRVFGYYIEVSKGQTAQVPETYIRKQTLTSGERYITQELKELESKILGAHERLIALEHRLFAELLETISAQLDRIQRTANAVAELDVLAALAQVAAENNYCRPVVDDGDELTIVEGRHPVVEQMLKGSLFVPNDTTLNCSTDRCLIITGPNMAGKSTYMRQNALIALMAQIGSFVPAKECHVGVVDAIFTRIGASDDLSAGQSTFMVEMTEVAEILKNATTKSLVILDEIGRGTSTFDGMSIARAVVEHISDPAKGLGCKTLFATHYHELTDLEGILEGVKNYNIAVKKRGEDITFLRRIVRGPADDSYGIEVAKLAGLPGTVTRRAHEVLRALEASAPKNNVEQMDFDALQEYNSPAVPSEVLEKLEALDVETLTPIEALNFLYELKKTLKGSLNG